MKEKKRLVAIGIKRKGEKSFKIKSGKNMGDIVNSAKITIGNAIGTTPESENFLLKRAEFAEKYCEEKGWPENVFELSIPQLMEIRKQDGWIDPL